MHVPGSRTLRKLLRRFVVAPVRDFLRERRPSRLPRLALSDPQAAQERLPNPTQPQVPVLVGEWETLSRSLSEASGYFFSDNLLSNESSYLTPLAVLEQRPKGLAFLAVGPELLFSYAAVIEPALTFVVDIRRDNGSIQLLYKALFEEAATRSEWLALLLGRPYDESTEPGPAASMGQILEHVESKPPTQESLRVAQGRLLRRVQHWHLPHLPLGPRQLKRLHSPFFRDQLDITFQLRTPSRKTYPTLRSLLLARAPDGRERNFLAYQEGFAALQRQQRENRIVPVVGDLTGDQAILGVAAELRRRKIPLGVLYLSNVEQYVFEERRWKRWILNLRELPLGEGAVLVRSYVDQGRPHPRQRPGHRITTVVQSAEDFLERERQRGHRSFWEVVTATTEASAVSSE